MIRTVFYYACDVCSTVKVISPQVMDSMKRVKGFYPAAPRVRIDCWCETHQPFHGLLKIEEIYTNED